MTDSPYFQNMHSLPTVAAQEGSGVNSPGVHSGHLHTKPSGSAFSHPDRVHPSWGYKLFVPTLSSLLRFHLLGLLAKIERPLFFTWVGKIPWRREWQPTLLFLPGESHGWRSPVGCSPRGRKESDITERLTHQVLENVLAFSQAAGWQWGPWGCALQAQGWREAWLCLRAPAAHFLCIHSLLLSLHDVYFTGQLFMVTNRHPTIELSSGYGNCQEAQQENVICLLSEVRPASLLRAPGCTGLWTRAQDTQGVPAPGQTPPRPALLRLQL